MFIHSRDTQKVQYTTSLPPYDNVRAKTQQKIARFQLCVHVVVRFTTIDKYPGIITW